MANQVQGQLIVHAQAPLNPPGIAGNVANAGAPNPPVNPIPVVDTFLKQSHVETELRTQAQRVEHKYQIIAICCGVVMAVAVLAIILGVGIPAIMSIPMVHNAYGQLVPAPGYDGLYTGLLLLLIWGPMLGPLLLGFGTFGIGMGILNCKVDNINALIEKSNKEFKGNNDRIAENHIHTLLDGADDETIIKFISKMDFNQLQASEKYLGSRKLHKLLSSMTEAKHLQHEAWLTYTSLAIEADKTKLIKKIQELFDSPNTKNPMFDPSILLDLLRREQNDLSVCVLAAKAISDFALHPEKNDKDELGPFYKQHPVLPLQSNIGAIDLKSSNSSDSVTPSSKGTDWYEAWLTETKPIANIGGEVSIKAAKEQKPAKKEIILAFKTAETDLQYLDQINISAKFLSKYSSFFEVSIDQALENNENQMTLSDVDFNIDSINDIKSMITFLTDENPVVPDKKSFLRILSSSYKYFDRFTDVFQLAFSDKDLLDQLTKPDGITKEEFNTLKNKDLCEMKFEDLDKFKTKKENVIIVTFLEKRRAKLRILRPKPALNRYQKQLQNLYRPFLAKAVAEPIQKAVAVPIPLPLV